MCGELASIMTEAICFNPGDTYRFELCPSVAVRLVVQPEQGEAKVTAEREAYTLNEGVAKSDAGWGGWMYGGRGASFTVSVPETSSASTIVGFREEFGRLESSSFRRIEDQMSETRAAATSLANAPVVPFGVSASISFGTAEAINAVFQPNRCACTGPLPELFYGVRHVDGGSVKAAFVTPDNNRFPVSMRLMASDGGVLYAGTQLDAGAFDPALQAMVAGPGPVFMGITNLRPEAPSSCGFDGGVLPRAFFDKGVMTVNDF
jgi:hypothetical protein